MMFQQIGPYYHQDNVTHQSRPLSEGDVITDGFSEFEIGQFTVFRGKTYAIVVCKKSVNMDNIDRVGLRSLSYIREQCWRI